MKYTYEEIKSIYQQCGLPVNEDEKIEIDNFNLPNKLFVNEQLKVNTSFIKDFKNSIFVK